jgi:AcrR family transcriptional regulator
VNAFIKTRRATEPPKKRALQKEETRQRILQIARAHFERDGFEGASVRGIAAEAGVAAGTVLLHFADKRDLLHAALFDDLAALIETETAKRPAEGLEACLAALARRFFAYYRARPALSKTLLREALLAESPWRERFTGQVTRVHAYIAGLAALAKRRGELSAEADPALLGVAFFSFYYFALIGWVQGALADPVPLFERLLAEHLRGLAPPTPKRRKR